MSWTAPRTWIANEVVSAAQMNAHVRDNLLETAVAKATAAGQEFFSTGANALAAYTASKRKTADESVNNSTTVQNDDHLVWAVGANEVWAFEAHLFFTIASGDPGCKIAFTVPAASSGHRVMVTYNNALATVMSPTADLTTEVASNAAGTSILPVIVRGVYIGGANAGNVQLQWAQNSLVASNLTLKAGSYIDLKRMA